MPHTQELYIYSSFSQHPAMASHLLLFFWFLLQVKFTGQEEDEAREVQYTSKDIGLEQALRSPDEDGAK